MRWWIGTSGWSYDDWKGSFYPETMKSPEMLGWYGERPNAVEGPEGVPPALETRSGRWFDDEVFTALSDAGAALVLAETEKPEKDPPFVATTDRHVFFKHQDQGTGPRLAGSLLESVWGESPE